MKFSSTLLLGFIFLSCKQISFTHDRSLVLIGSADFRVSYASVMFDSAAAADPYTRKPNLMREIDKDLQNKLNISGFMDKDSIILSPFKTIGDLYAIKNKGGDSLLIFYKFDTIREKNFLYFKNDNINDSMELNIPPAYNITFADLIPGGYPEIFIVENVYISNGDNYFLRIYKVP